jgi:thioredoxin 1
MTTETDSGSPVQSTNVPLHVESEAHLESVVDGHDVVLVDFYASWCGPCQMLEPILAGLAGETDAVIAKVDVDEHQILTGDYGVRGVPTLLLFAEGELVERHTGALPADQLRALIEGYTAE